MVNGLQIRWRKPVVGSNPTVLFLESPFLSRYRGFRFLQSSSPSALIRPVAPAKTPRQNRASGHPCRRPQGLWPAHLRDRGARMPMIDNQH